MDSQVEEASIAQLQQQLAAGATTCKALVEAYLARMDRWDRAGPKLASILAVNPRAEEWAGGQDAGKTRAAAGPLHGVTVAVKDNCDTVDMPTTGGCQALRGCRPVRDSTVVRKLAAAGALVLAKANLHEFALAGLTASSLGGQTLNPYDLHRTPGGSSGGSGVAVTMSFTTVAIGSDTVNSIRSPSSANCTVGLRPTRGLVSRAGVMPVSSTQDVVGPMGRTVADVARVLDAIAGYDPADIVTACCVGRMPATYTDYPRGRGLRGRRIGFVPSLQGTGADCEDVNRATEAAMASLRETGAEVLSLDEFRVSADDLIRDLDVQKWEFKHLFNAYLARLPHAPVADLGALIAGGNYHRETLTAFLNEANAVEHADHDGEYLYRLLAIDRLRQRILNVMAERRLDALAYPLQRCLVVPVGSPSQSGRNGILAGLIGFPALTVPMGFSRPTAQAPIGVPMGLDLLARPFHEPLLFEVGQAFEEALQVRRPPVREGWPGE